MSKAIFIRNPKCATISIRNVLKYPGFNTRVDEDEAHQTATSWSKKPDYKDHFTFSVCRNPYDRLLSGWLFICRRKLDKHEKILETYGNDFNAFVHNLDDDFGMKLTEVDMVTWPQYKWMLDENGKCIVDEIGRFERLSSWWAGLCQSKGWPTVELPKSNSTKHSHWRDYYTPEMIKIVNKQYKEDFVLLNYEML
jgi:chondroitin 4-sulfotransferase 11